ncbi:MAG: hypothetical protein WBV89_14310, partial [Ilumatobacter sp.]
MIKSKKMLALGMVAALGVAACGSDDDSASDSDDTATTEAAEGDDTATTDAAEGDDTATTDQGEEDFAAAGPEGDICEVTDVGGVDDKGFNQLAFE